jgi:hypothetical protein
MRIPARRHRGILASAVQRRVAFVGAMLLALATIVTVAFGGGAQQIPARLGDAEYWKLVNDLSEPGGFFRSENFVSNETTFQWVIPELTRERPQGGIYLGVGPEQNFTYITALRPKMAFIVDIRRQNMLQHLLYKAVMEKSEDRADFLSRLFSRPRPAGLDTTASPAALFEAFDAIEPDSAIFWKNIAAIRKSLTEEHDFELSEEDLKTIDYVYFAFYAAGPYLNYSFSPSRGGFAGRRMPTFAELMVQTDEAGASRSFLATEESFRFLRDMHRKNLIVPVVGDFAGDKALRAVGTYVRERNATITAFYTSNVEQYLFQQGDDWRRFFGNVAALPVDEQSTFIRAVFNYTYLRDQPPGPGPRSVTLLHPIREAVQAFNEGKILSYYDVVQLSR